MNALDAQIIKYQETLSKLREQRRQEKLRKAKEANPPKPRGRPRISEDKLINVVKLAETKTLTAAAMKAGVGLTTLYKYGISRARLEGKTRC